MSFTVNDALKLEVFRQTRLLAGEKGLHKQILSVNVLELLDDMAHIREQQLLITTAYGLDQDKVLQENLIPMLAKRHLSCLVVQTGHYLQQVPEKVIRDASNYALPLLELPPSASFSEITTQLLTHMVNYQFNLLEYKDKVQQELLQVVLENGGFPELLQILSRHLPYPLCILDENLSPVITRDVTTEMLASLPGGATNFHRQINRADKGPGSQGKHLLLPVVAAGGQLLGYIGAFSLPGDLEDREFTVLLQAATVSALLFLQEIAVRETENRLRGDLLEDLLTGSIPSREEAVRRAGLLGYDLDQEGLALLGSIDNYSTLAQNKSRIEMVNLKHKLLHSSETALKKSGAGQYMFRLRSDGVVALVLSHKPQGEAWQNGLADVVRKSFASAAPGVSLSLGMGRFHGGVSGFAHSYDEACQALSLARRLQGEGAFASFSQLGAYRLLMQLNEEQIKEYCQEAIGTLLDYDRRRGTQLIETLKAYLDCGRNIQGAAKELYAHRQTVRYRLQRISEITGLDLANPEHSFNLHLGLKLYDLVHSPEGTKEIR